MINRKNNVVALKSRPVVHEPQPRLPTGETSAPLRVLIIDDTPEDRMVVRLALEAHGYLLSEADNGEHGLAAVAGLQPDCIVLDYKLPDMDGEEILAALAGPDGLMPCAVVMLTGPSNVTTAARLMRAGALDTLSKDRLDEDNLRRAVDGAVHRFQLIAAQRTTDARNAQLAAIVAASTDAIISVGMARRVLTWNAGAMELIGYGEAEVVGRNVDDLIVPQELQAELFQIYDAVENGRQSVLLQSELRHKDGSRIPVELTVSPIVGERDGVRGFSVVFRDISERLRAEKAVRRSESQLRLSLKAANAGVWSWDLADRSIYWSPETFALYALTPSDAPPTIEEWGRLIHPDDRGHVENASRDAIVGRVGEFRCEFRVIAQDESVRWIEAVGSVDRDENDRVVRMSGINTDVTHRKGIEHALAASEAYNRRLLEASPDCLKFIDLDGRVQKMNSNGQCLMEIDNFETVCGQHWQSLWPDESRSLIEDAITDALAGTTGRFVGFCPTEKGTPKWWDVAVNAVPGVDGRPIGLLAASRDITERKRTDEQIQVLVREVTHRSKNLLGVVQAVARQTVTHSTLETFDRSFSERINALAASHDLLVASDWQGVDLAELVRSQLQPFCGEIDAQIRLHGPDVRVSSAAAQTLGMALHELATNAAKYGALSRPDGQVEIVWDMSGTCADRVFTMTWRELNGPPVTAPARRGFGTTVVSHLVKSSLEAEVRLDYAPSGVVWRIECGSARVLDA